MAESVLKPASEKRLAELLGRHPYGKTTQDWKQIALEHWRLYRPKWSEEMGEDNLIAEAIEAAQKTQAEIQALMQRGFQYHEAEEMVREKYILVKPGPEEEEESEE